LQRAPDGPIVASIESLTRGALGDLPLRNLYIRVVQPGRTTYVLIHALLDADTPGMNVRTADRHRRAVIDAVTAAHAPVILDLLFTAEAELAEPTTGFGPLERTDAPPIPRHHSPSAEP
jgi:predicted Co/Zn/Cd cation transporter (cation efflux family)